MWADCIIPEVIKWYDWLIPRLSRYFNILPCLFITPPSYGIKPDITSPSRNPEDFADFINGFLIKIESPRNIDIKDTELQEKGGSDVLVKQSVVRQIYELLPDGVTRVIEYK
jgi:hypothetical protein